MHNFVAKSQVSDESAVLKTLDIHVMSLVSPYRTDRSIQECAV